MPEDWFDRLKQVIADDGRTQRVISIAAGMGPNYVQQMLKKDQPPKLNTLERLMEVLGPEAAKRVRLPGAGQHPHQVQKVGYVGAGQAIVPFEADESEWVEAPPEVAPGTVAVEVRGESMLPAYDDGYLLYYSKKLPPEEMVNKRCVVQLANGSMLVKTLRRGTSPGFWNLGSLNAYDIEDQVIDWAAPIDWIKPR
jgi:transcriptional regulator with XRE-family HTH domain